MTSQRLGLALIALAIVILAALSSGPAGVRVVVAILAAVGLWMVDEA